MSVPAARGQWSLFVHDSISSVWNRVWLVDIISLASEWTGIVHDYEGGQLRDLMSFCGVYHKRNKAAGIVQSLDPWCPLGFSFNCIREKELSLVDENRARMKDISLASEPRCLPGAEQGELACSDLCLDKEPRIPGLGLSHWLAVCLCTLLLCLTHFCSYQEHL